MQHVCQFFQIPLKNERTMSRILGASLKEVLVGTVQVTKGLLNGNRGDICQPGMLFLQIGQHSREVVIGQLLPILGIGGFAGTESPIVDKAAASEHLRKDTFLALGRWDAIFVCSLRLAHCLLPFTNIGISYHICQYTNIHSTGDDSEHFFIQKGYPCAQAPNKEAPSIPMSKGQGFYGALDNHCRLRWVRIFTDVERKISSRDRDFLICPPLPLVLPCPSR